ncbi:unnamed protein product [Rhizophagus irregularis]|nr:unnamed protein product [Rhizophagus irregularis]
MHVYSGEHNLVSANDALVAHLWRLVTRARGIPLDAEVICAFPCDGRKRLKPFFLPNYFDFGYGTPLRFSLRRGRNLDGIVILLGTKYDDGIQAYTSLIIEHMQKLEQDPEFKEFFQIS